MDPEADKAVIRRLYNEQLEVLSRRERYARSIIS